MNYQISTIGESKLIEFLKNQIKNSINEFDKCTETDNLNDESDCFKIIIVDKFETKLRESLDKTKNPFMIILINPADEIIIRDNIFYGTFSEKVRKDMVFKGFITTFLIPFSLKQTSESFEEACNEFDEDIISYIKESIIYYWEKPFRFYKNQFSSNGLYRQILKAVNLYTEKIKIPNANMDYKYNPGERPDD